MHRNGRLLPLIAAERALRGLLLLAASVYLFAQRNSDLGATAEHIARTIDIDPQHGLPHRLIAKLHTLHAHQLKVIAALALGYGLLELVEGVGLWLRKRWAEWLTVIATSALVPFEVYELIHRANALKAGGLAVNLLIVGYLVRVLRQNRHRHA